ncbi:TPA: bifunctional NUDIX hydrolase/phosphatase PAP2 family protein [Photobacterium damselae]
MHNIIGQRILLLFFILVSLTFGSIGSAWASSTTSEVPEGIVGAVCVIRHDNKVVMISEVITEKLALPGGYIDSGYNAPQTAIREALEETGLHVHVDKFLQYRGRAAIYACVANDPIPVTEFKTKSGFTAVASWSSAHFGKEVKQVYLINPFKVDGKNYRYPDDIVLLKKWLQQTPNSAVTYYHNLSQEVNPLHRWELSQMLTFQHWVDGLSSWQQTLFSSWMTVTNLPGEYGFIFTVLFGCLIAFGPVSFLRLSTVMLSVTMVASIIKLTIASPRPFYIIPALQKVAASGYGFPSGHTLMALVLWGFIGIQAYRYIKVHNPSAQLMRWRLGIMSTVVLFSLSQAVARVWYGVHFISDTLASLVIGSVMIASFTLWINLDKHNLTRCMTNKWFWLNVTVVFGLIAGTTQAPDHIYLFSCVLAIFLINDYVPRQYQRLNLRYLLGLITCLLIGGSVILYSGYMLINLSNVSLIVLAIRSITIVVLITWILGCSSWFYRQTCPPLAHAQQAN